MGSYKHKMAAPNSAHLSSSQAKTFRFTIFYVVLTNATYLDFIEFQQLQQQKSSHKHTFQEDS